MANVRSQSQAIIVGTIAALFIIPNIFSGIVGGIWLAVEWEWGIILIGIGIGIIMPWIFAIVSMPAMGLMLMISRSIETGNRGVMATGGMIAALYNAVMITGWTLLVFVLVTSYEDDCSLIPLFLWGYATTMSPLGYMARGEPDDSTGTSLGLLLAHITYIVLVILFLFDVSWLVIIYSLAGLSLLEALFAIFVGLSTMSQPEQEWFDELQEDDHNDQAITDNTKDIETELYDAQYYSNKGYIYNEMGDTPYRILHIDYDPVTLKFVRAKLEASNFTVTTAEDIKSGIKAVKETSPDLVIMEVMMPGMDGAEMCRRIREWSDVPIIWLSVKRPDEDVKELLNLGADDYVVKPFDISDLITRILAVLKRKSGGITPE